MPHPIALLAFNGAAQILVSSLLGVFMLIPMQPWGRALAPHVNMKSLLATHLDWIQLAFMQLGAAFILDRWRLPHAGLCAGLLMFGGWMNALPYLLRSFRINAFVLAGDWKQRAAAGLAALSVAAILAAWSLVLTGLWPIVIHAG